MTSERSAYQKHRVRITCCASRNYECQRGQLTVQAIFRKSSKYVVTIYKQELISTFEHHNNAGCHRASSELDERAINPHDPVLGSLRRSSIKTAAFHDGVTPLDMVDSVQEGSFGYRIILSVCTKGSPIYQSISGSELG